ncbi:MAG: hypothetical protein BWK80_25845 [Desulfobacteraceae bacterium IS3]|nr:MAG: hypothetical protein BWK80_25845 [Desulfobacteraceae bacterium IS3]
MSNQLKQTFIHLCTNGYLLTDDIDDYVDMWHESDKDEELYDFLGMSRQEYRLWVHDPDMLDHIIAARVQNCSLDDVLNKIDELPMAARADSPAKAKILMQWLKKSGV